MIQVLTFLTTLINLVGLAICLCLGFYVVTRTLRSRVSWLAAFLLWSMTGFYLHNTMAIHVPVELNRDIMSKLYVGEGTFNRTRRRATRAMARAMQEMEQEAQKMAA